MDNVNKIIGKSLTFVESVDGKAVFWVGTEKSFEVYKRHETDIGYTGPVLSFNDSSIRKWKPELQVEDVKEILPPKGFKGDASFGEVKIPCVAFDEKIWWDSDEIAHHTWTKLQWEVIHNIATCASDDCTRRYMEVTHVDQNGDVVATDGKAMAVMKSSCRLPDELNMRLGTVIPKPKGDVVMTVLPEHWVKFSDGKETFIVRNETLMEQGNSFPKYERCIPDTRTFSPFTIDLKMCEKNHTFLNQHRNRIYLSDGNVYVEGKVLGSYKGDVENIPFNWKYLKQTQKAKPMAWFNPDPTKACVFGDIDDYFHVVMPMHW